MGKYPGSYFKLIYVLITELASGRDFLRIPNPDPVVLLKAYIGDENLVLNFQNFQWKFEIPLKILKNCALTIL